MMKPDLFEAAFYGDIRDLKRAISAGQKAGTFNEHGQTAIHIAAANGHVACIATLLEYGVDVDLVDVNECTPLHVATRQGHLDAIKYLLEKGASKDRGTGKGYQIMSIARSQGHSDVVRYLKQILNADKSPWE